MLELVMSNDGFALFGKLAARAYQNRVVPSEIVENCELALQGARQIPGGLMTTRICPHVLSDVHSAISRTIGMKGMNILEAHAFIHVEMSLEQHFALAKLMSRR